MVRKNFKMYVPRYRTIAINGAVLDVDITHEEFSDEFMKWVESKNWSFIGITDETTEEEAAKNFMDLLEDERDEEE
ncbi:MULTISPECIES: hypothetical protein [unclassified Bacillus (in: firmicutes)]|uniref:hypothetical protein n=1 Tax=unclassified Bacillus (in: firmicutes) TaxID=185979 RepID=UPI003D1F37D8